MRSIIYQEDPADKFLSKAFKRIENDFEWIPIMKTAVMKKVLQDILEVGTE